jgi:hydroxymethylpyrimidine pyrophosphatase-like HAD family hydrolase
MFKQAGTSIAMGQAVDEVRAAAVYVTASNDEEGWARGIEKYVLGLPVSEPQQVVTSF